MKNPVLRLEPLAGHAYVAGMATCPVVVRILVAEPLEVAAAIHVTAATLDLVDDEEVSFGFMTSTMSDLSRSIVLRPGAPHEIVCDVLEHDVDEDKELIVAGRYMVRIDVVLHMKVASGPGMIMLEGELPLDVAD